jgi:hypothetical protein
MSTTRKMNDDIRALRANRLIDKAYWPRPWLNESADLAKGNAAVDKLSVGDLAAFFKYVTTGPTYCLVKRHCATYPFTFKEADDAK